MNTTPAQASYLSTLEMIVARQIAERHCLVCSRDIARRAIRSLRQARAAIAA